MKWVLNTYKTCQEWDLDKIIEVCQKTGHEGIEFLMDFNQPHGVEADASPDHILNVQQKVCDAGLEVAFLSSCASFDAEDQAGVRASIDKVKRVIDHADRMGTRHVRVMGDRIPDEKVALEPRLDQIADAIGVLGDYAKPMGITVSMEMHKDFTDPLLALEIINRSKRSNTGLVFNCQWRIGEPHGWSLPPGAPSIQPLLDLTMKHYTSVHTHGFEQPEETQYYRELFTCLVARGYNGYVSNECAYTGPDPICTLSLYTAFFRAVTAAAMEQSTFKTHNSK